MNLASRDGAHERASSLHQHLCMFVRNRPDEPLVWCAVPALVKAAVQQPIERHRVPEPVPRARVARLHERRLAGLLGRPRVADGCRRDAACLFVARTPNLLASQRDIQRHFGELTSLDPDGLISRTDLAAVLTNSGAMANELVEWARSEQLALPVDALAIHRAFMWTGRLLDYWGKVLAREAARAVVVGSLGASRFRTLLEPARLAGIATVYVPHAPLTVQASEVGLPVDYAALRGEEEARHLAHLGAPADRLDVAGDPSFAAERTAVDTSLPPAFAAPKDEAGRVPMLVAVIRAATGDQILVSRHPARQSNPLDGMFPPAWGIWPGRTCELLKRGPPVVLQHSSGVALEALGMGLEVIELHVPGTQPRYPFMREPHVRFASGADELRSAIAAARAAIADQDRAEQLSAYARGWAGPTGREAVDRAIALVERARDEPAPGPIWDPWRVPAA